MFLLLQDEKLLKSTLVTERVQLWDKYTDRINQHSVKMSFIKKVHRRNPPFRLKMRHPRRKTTQVNVLLHSETLKCIFIWVGRFCRVKLDLRTQSRDSEMTFQGRWHFNTSQFLIKVNMNDHKIHSETSGCLTGARGKTILTVFGLNCSSVFKLDICFNIVPWWWLKLVQAILKQLLVCGFTIQNLFFIIFKTEKNVHCRAEKNLSSSSLSRVCS